MGPKPVLGIQWNPSDESSHAWLELGKSGRGLVGLLRKETH